MKKILFGFIILVVIALAAIVGFTQGISKVRKGLVENYPVVQGIAKSNIIEQDSFLHLNISAETDSALFFLLNQGKSADSLTLHIPYHAVYGIDPSRFMRAIETEEGIEVWLPRIIIRYSEFKFDNLTVNETPVTLNAPQKRHLQTLLLPYLNKVKREQKTAKDHLSRQFMYYFMPYKYQLRMFFENQEHPLPAVPGINQSVEDAIKERIGG